MRTKNQLQAMALSHGVQKKYKLWTQAGRAELEQLPFRFTCRNVARSCWQSWTQGKQRSSNWTGRSRGRSAAAAGGGAVDDASGSGAPTALAMVLTLGPAERFESAKQVGSYFGLIPSEESSGGKQRLGRISKQGSSFLRFLLVEAGQTAARYYQQLKRFYRRLATRKNRGVAKVAVARKLATRMYLMLREGWTYAQLNQAVMSVSPSHSVAGE